MAVVFRVLALVAGVALLGAVFVATCHAAAFDSDGLYPLALAIDPDPDALHGWRLTPAPSYLDLGIMAVLTRITTTLRPVHELYALIFLLALVGASYRVHRAFGLDRLDAALSAVLGVAAVYGARREFSQVRQSLYLPAFHGTTLVLVLLACGSLVDRVRRHAAGVVSSSRARWALPVAGVLVGLVACGDVLALTQILVPLAVLFVLAGVGLRMPRSFRHDGVTFGATLIAGFALGRLLARAAPARPEPHYVTGVRQVRQVLFDLLGFLRSDSPFEGKNAAYALVSTAFLVAAVILTVREARRRAPLSPVAFGLLFALLVIGCGFAVPVALGQMALRYLLPTCVFPVLLATLPLRLVRAPVEGRARALILAASAFAATSALAGGASAADARAAEAVHEAQVVAAARSLAERNIHTGFAYYWRARPFALLARGLVRMTTLDGSRLGWWLTNANAAFERDAATGRLSFPSRFFVYDLGLRREDIEEAFGSPVAVEDVGTAHVLLFDFEPRHWARLMRGLCEIMSEDDAVCPPARGRLNLLPLLDAPETGLRAGLDLALPNGAYRLRLQTGGQGRVSFEAAEGERPVDPARFVIATAEPAHRAQPLHVVVRYEPGVVLEDLILEPAR